MNKVEELIEKFCPDGVEYKMLGEVCEIGTGNSNRQDAVENGKYPFFVRSVDVLSINSCEFDEEAIVIPGEGGIGDIFHYINGKYALHQRAYRIHFIDKRIITKFAYYFLFSKFKSYIFSKAVNATVSSIRKPMIEQFEIPIPPLPIQEAIVKILDNFSSLTAELQAELQARKSQYEFYRNELLTFDREDADTSSLLSDVSTSSLKESEHPNTTNSQDNPRVTTTIGKPQKVKWMRLGDVGTLTRGGSFQKKDFMDKGVGCIHYGQIYTYFGTYTDKVIKFLNSDVAKKQPKASKGDLVITLTSENIEDVCKCVAWLGDDDIAISGHAAILHHNQNPKYLAYYLQTKMFFDQKKKYARGAKVIEMQSDKLATIEIPIPSLSEQERIVSILDRFDTLVNDISTGLPAEISARQQQYEYYRDKLLTFKRKG